MPKLLLEGIRIVDLTAFWSGPFAAVTLANMGAEVIKLEAGKRMDGWRGAGVATLPEERIWERAPLFNSMNTDKLGITLDLSNPKGVEIFKKLVKISDVVMENFTPRVMKNFGLDYPVLKEVNPKIIMMSMPAHGSTGPWKDKPGFAYPIEQMSGIPQLTGNPDGPPRMTETSPSDPAAGINGAMAILNALLYRQRTGKGQYIDLSQIEALTGCVGDAVVEYTMNKKIRPRYGNHHPFWAPQGYYRCKGADKWVGITVKSDAEWVAFCKAIGRALLANDERFADSMSRSQNQDELDKLIEEWTVENDKYEVMNILQKAGIAAAPVMDGIDHLNDPHLNERGTYQKIDREVSGTHRLPIPTSPMRFSKCPIAIRRPAPTLGEHNEYVFGELLGMSQQEIQALYDEKITGKLPTAGLLTKI